MIVESCNLILAFNLFVVVQLLSCEQLFSTPWSAALQASLSFTISQSLLRFMSIESVMLSNHVILCHSLHILPSIFASIRVFSNELAFHLRGKNIGVSASAPVLPMNIQSWFSLGSTGLISLKSKGLSRVFSSTTNSKGRDYKDTCMVSACSVMSDSLWPHEF